jgi:hypothetical protein
MPRKQQKKFTIVSRFGCSRSARSIHPRDHKASSVLGTLPTVVPNTIEKMEFDPVGKSKVDL